MSKIFRREREWLWLAAMLCIGLTANPAPLSAQSGADQDAAEIETQQFEDWTLRCRPASETQLRNCFILQNVVAEDSGKPVLQVVARKYGPEKVLGAVISVPVGVRLPPGLGIQVDERALRVFPFEICDSRSCEVRAVLDADLLQDFKAGLTGHVKVQDADGQEMIVRFSLKGFSAALQALP